MNQSFHTVFILLKKVNLNLPICKFETYISVVKLKFWMIVQDISDTKNLPKALKIYAIC